MPGGRSAVPVEGGHSRQSGKAGCARRKQGEVNPSGRSRVCVKAWTGRPMWPGCIGCRGRRIPTAQGWSRDRIVDEILRRLRKITLLEAHRFANGWTRQDVTRALDHYYERAGLQPPRIALTEVCRWEHGQHVPNPERQEYLCRVYRTRPDRLGVGRGFSENNGPACV